MIVMPKELQQAVRSAQNEPVRLADPETSAEYVMIPAELYDRIEPLFLDDTFLSNTEKSDLLLKAGLRAYWDDPEMDAYNALDPRTQFCCSNDFSRFRPLPTKVVTTAEAERH
jgi:hypothetical protein